MAYLNLETSIPTHKKFLNAGAAASWLWFCGLCHCKHGLTNGFIAEEALDFLGVKKARPLAARLVTVRLWDVVPGGWQMHDYLEHNKTADEVRAVMRKRAEGGKLGGRPVKAAPVEPKNLEGLQLKTLKVSENNLPDNLPENPFLPSVPSILPSNQPVEEGAAPSATPPPPPFMEFPVTGSGPKIWPLTQAHLDDLQRDYPLVDVPAECRKARAWLKANAGRMKTARGMPAFLVNWLNNGVNTRRAVLRQSSPERAVEVDEWHAECKRLHGGTCGSPYRHANQLAIDEHRKGLV